MHYFVTARLYAAELALKTNIAFFLYLNKGTECWKLLSMIDEENVMSVSMMLQM
jgi:hypothetical protein